MANGIFSCDTWIPSHAMWDPVPWPGTEPRRPALGAESPNHWTTREVPLLFFFYISSSNIWEEPLVSSFQGKHPYFLQPLFIQVSEGFTRLTAHFWMHSSLSVSFRTGITFGLMLIWKLPIQWHVAKSVKCYPYLNLILFHKDNEKKWLFRDYCRRCL